MEFFEIQIPENIKTSLQLYVEKKIPTGGFLEAVLSNDLMLATASADYYNSKILKEICTYVYNELPANCWGSREIVQKWLNSK